MELYIHIPFCVKKCDYCDFLSFSADEQTQRSYVAALQKELVFYGAKYKGRRITTIFIGHTFLAERRVYAGGHGNCISEFCCGWGCGDHDRV